MEDLTKDPHAPGANGISEAHKDRATVLRFYIGPREKPGLGMDVSTRLFADPDLGRLVIEGARSLIDDLEREIGRDGATERSNDPTTKRPNE